MEKLIFWAQALDNMSPDHIEMSGEELHRDDWDRRQMVVSLLARVSELGVCVFRKDGVELTANDHHFVIEIPSVQRDIVGRIAPVVCYAECEQALDDSLGASLAVGLNEFATRIGRSLKPEQIILVPQALTELKKKSSKKRLVRGVTIAAIASTLLVLSLWLMNKYW